MYVNKCFVALTSRTTCGVARNYVNSNNSTTLISIPDDRPKNINFTVSGLLKYKYVYNLQLLL